MDWIVWITAGIILIGFLVGIYRGALRIAVSIITAVMTIVITFFITPYAAQIVMDKTPLDESIGESVVNSMEDTLLELLGNDVKVPEETADEEEVDSDGEIPRDVQIQAIENSELPEVFKKLLTENNNDEIYTELGVETFSQYAGTYLAKLMIHVATFLSIFLLATIILRAIVFALNVVNDIPVFGLMNRLAGGVAGAAFSLIVIWFVMVLVVLFYSTGIGKTMYEIFRGNALTRIIMDYNPLLTISIKI